MDLVDAAKNLSLTELTDAITHVSLHSAYPSTSGINELTGGSPAYARKAVTWGTAASGAIATATGPAFDVAGGSTVRFAGLWSASTGGTFYGSIPLGPVGDPFLATAIAATDFFTGPGHGLANDTPVVVSKTLGALPTGVTDGGIYYVSAQTTDTFKLAATAGGSAIDLTASGRAMIRQITPEVFGGQGTYTIAALSLQLA